MSDPEEWVNLEDRDSELWEFELRVSCSFHIIPIWKHADCHYLANLLKPCSERVLMTLSNQYQDYVTPLLESTFKQVVGTLLAFFIITCFNRFSIDESTVDLPSIIQKEALYCAIGRCAPRLKDIIPFEQWLSHNLIFEARETNPKSVSLPSHSPLDTSYFPSSYPIVKRRIAWLIGKWISDMCSPADSSTIWEVLVHLLRDRGHGTDAVVRLTAAVALKECIDVRFIHPSSFNGGDSDCQMSNRVFSLTLTSLRRSFLRSSLSLWG